MSKTIKIAFLNLFRNKRRTVFNVIAVSVALTAYLAISAFIQGEKDIMYELAVKFLAGHVQVHAAGYDAKANLVPVDITIDGCSDLAGRLRQIPEVIEVRTRADFAGFISDGHNKMGVFCSGIIPADETTEVFIQGLITEGDLAGRDIDRGNEVIVGKGMADLFGFRPGDELFITADNRYKQPNMDAFRIVGIYVTSFPLFDESNVFIPLDSARTFLGFGPDEASVIHVKAAGMAQVAEVHSAVTAAVGPGFEVYDWKHFSPEVVNAVKADEVSYAIINGILIFLMLFGILNTMSMSIYERYPEIGTMRALGFPKRDITFMLVWEGMLTGLAGLAVAMVFGSAINWFTSTVGFTIPESMTADIKIPFWDRFLSKPLPIHYLKCALIAAVAPGIAALYPAYKALRKSVVEELYFIK